MARRLEDKVGLVTGGASGIGRATAMVFARAGAKVVLADLGVDGGEEVVRLIKEAGGEAILVRCDVSRTAGVDAMINKAVETYGRLDYAFNNAGIEGDLAPAVEYTEENCDRVIPVNLKGVWLCMKYEIRQMLKRDPGQRWQIARATALPDWTQCIENPTSRWGFFFWCGEGRCLLLSILERITAREVAQSTM